MIFEPAGYSRRASACGRHPGLQALLTFMVVALLTNLLAACGKSEAPKTAAAANAAPPPAVPVTVIAMTPRSVPIGFEVVGQTEGSKQVEVRARVSGILEKRLYTEGEPVKAGQALFQIDRAPYEIALEQAKAALNQEKARGAQVQRESERLKPLVQERAISRKEYDDATSAVQLSEAAQQQFAARVREAELNLSYTLVKAPLTGISGRAEHSEGSLITTDANGSLLTTINQVTPIYVRFSLAQTDLAKLPNGQLGRGSRIDVGLLRPDGSRYPGKGRLNFAATGIDPKLGTQQLRAEFDNPDRQLVPGEFVRVQIVAGQRDNVFLVPQSAVLQTEKGYFVFATDAENKAAMRPIKVGEWVGSDWTVLSGLSTGDHVIIDNLLKVRPGAPVAPSEAKPATAAADAAQGGGAPAAAAAAVTGGAPATAKAPGSSAPAPANTTGK